MHFDHRSSREVINNKSGSLKPDHNVRLSFLYHSTREWRFSHSISPTYYSLATMTMSYLPTENTRSFRSKIQISIYNFLERPTGLKCFIYHFSVYVSIYVCCCKFKEKKWRIVIFIFKVSIYDDFYSISNIWRWYWLTGRIKLPFEEISNQYILLLSMQIFLNLIMKIYIIVEWILFSITYRITIQMIY